MITVILWDVDGTLLDFKKSEYAAIKKCFEIFNLVECTDEMIQRYSEINRKYWEKLETVETEYLEKMRKSEEQRWKHMEEHFESLDRSIREKQEEGKRKKHSIF